MSRQPTASTDSVAQDQIRAFVERILRMKEEAKAINDDIREIYAEAKGNGFDKTVLGKVVSYVEKRGKDSNAVAEQDALFDLYLTAFDGTPSRTHAHAREDRGWRDKPRAEIGKVETVLLSNNEPADREHITGSVGKEFPNNEPAPPATPEESGGPSAGEGAGVALPADTNTNSEEADAASEPVAAPRAEDGAEAQDGAGAGAEVAASVGVRADDDGADEPAAEVDPIAPDTAAETDALPARVTISETPGAGAPAVEEGAHNPTSSTVQPNTQDVHNAPGSIRTEKTPVGGLEWHSYLRVWPELFGREFADLVDDVRANGVTKPIVMQGNIVLDGRARYLAARQALVEYPVQEYAGDDPLADIIAWNMASRKPHLVARQMIAKSLIKLVPDRADEIGELLDLSQVREAAQ